MVELFYNLVAVCHKLLNAEGENFLTKFELFTKGEYAKLAEMASKNIDKFLSDLRLTAADFQKAYQEKKSHPITTKSSA